MTDLVSNGETETSLPGRVNVRVQILVDQYLSGVYPERSKDFRLITFPRSAPFMPEALEALAALKSDNRAAFEALRSQLKKAGCRVI